jgi:hypothetical protein
MPGYLLGQGLDGQLPLPSPPSSSFSVLNDENPAGAGFPGADDEIRTRDLHLGKVAL